MNKRKHYGKKIRKTKNLYRKKKTAGQKVFGTVALVLTVSAVAFLGFCIGKPLLDYLGSIGTEPVSEWTPQASYSEKLENSPSEGDVGGVSETAPDSGNGQIVPNAAENSGSAAVTSPAVSDAQTQTAPQDRPAGDPVAADVLVSTEAPASALANRSSLAAVLAKAKSGGYNAVVIQLKDRNGYFRYKTEVSGTENTKLVAGTMKLSEIMSVFKENDMIPVAEISVLSDNAGCEVFSGMNYKCIGTTTSWLDYTLTPPQRWANPESSDTREYFAEISAELVTAGFENIILTDVIFPNFQNYDRAYIDAKYYDASRYKMLYNVVKAGNMIEMKASDVIAEQYGRTAELLGDPSQLHDNAVALVISRKDLPTDAGFPADAKSLVETVLSLVSNKTGELEIVPVIDGKSFDDAEKAKITGALASLGYVSYVMRDA